MDDFHIEKRLDEAMPWVGVYIAAASAICTRAMAADAFNGFRRKKLWFPCTYFSLNPTSLTLLGVAMKLTMDLTAVMKYIKIAKLTTLIFMSTAMGNFMSSLGSIDGKHILSNVVALVILVITVLVNVIIRLIMLVSANFYIVPMILMFFSLATLVSLAIAAPAMKRSLETTYREKHRAALRGEVLLLRKEVLGIDERRRCMMKYWVMAATSSPQFVMARSVVCTMSALLCLIALIALTIAYVLVWERHEGPSVYGSSIEWIMYTQIVGVAVGTIAPFMRWFVVVSFKHSASSTNRLRDEIKIERYWKKTLVDVRESFSSFRIGQGKFRKCLHDAKWFAVTFCIRIQILIVLLSKLFVFVSAFLMTPFFFFWKKRYSDGSDNRDKDLNLSRYVLLLEGEAELPSTVVKNICREADNIIQSGKMRQPQCLINLVSKFDNFKGLGLFDSDQIPRLHSQEPPNCWSLPVLTLASIALAVPHTAEKKREDLLSSVREGLYLAKLVEKTLVKNDRRLNIREATDMCWVGVLLYMKWLDFDLKRMSLECKNSKEILQELSDKAQRIVVEYLKRSFIEDPLDWPARVIAANSMYRISRTVALSVDEEDDEGVFEKLCVMIADIMAACVTNLPNVITMMCQGSAIEKREKSVRKAFMLLGKTQEIVEVVQQQEWPPMDHDRAAEIEEWRLWFRRSENGVENLATDEQHLVVWIYEMIDGDGIEEKQSPEVATQGDRESDGGDDFSHYSSCGGESEFERYCSATSAMGTPSFRGSSLYDSDFGSLKSFKLGGDNSDFNKILGAEMALSGYRESECESRGNELCRDVKDNGTLSLNGGIEGFVVDGVDLRGNVDADGDWGNGVVTESEMKGTSDGNVRIRGEVVEAGKGKRFRRGVEKVSDNGEGLEVDGGEARNLSDEDKASSRCEHSEGEDSMFGCGSDDERKIDSYYGKNVPCHVEESGTKENRLIMNSAVAFGGDDWDDFVHESNENTIGSMAWGEFQAESKAVAPIGTGSLSFSAEVESGDKLPKINVNAQSTVSANLDAQSENAKRVIASRDQASDIDELDEYLGSVTSVNDIFQTKKGPPEKAPANENFKTELEMKNQNVATSEAISIHHDITSKRRNLEDKNIKVDPLSDSVVNQNDLVAVKVEEEKGTRLSEDSSSFAFPLVADTRGSAAAKSNLPSAFDQIEDHFVPAKTRDFELNEFYDEFVNDMEDILLDSAESPASSLAYSTRISQPQFLRPPRDGGSSASTSGADYACNWIHQPQKIDRVEVVGARQRKGDVSFSERLVGIQKYTVYKLKVWSGEDQWEVERRYRDFYTLYHRLKKLFADNGWTLPLCWSSIDRESRKLFGNASPDVIAERSVLIQECLQSVIHHRFPSSYLNALTSFLSPTETVPSSPASDTGISQSTLANRGSQPNDFSTLGKTISLVVQIRPLKSMKQMLDEQHYRCAGCHRNFDDGRTRMQELVQVLGWGKPRLCEYSGQLFCSSCHTNDTAVLPARVLHHWDFTRYPVSQLAKSFLDSIHDQPMLCVSAVNPFLFSKVPTLQHVANVRNRVRMLLPYVHCQFHRSIYKGLGSRRYLLDSNDFFALKDLIDLSKGVFSALPVMLETVSRKIQEHITDQCLICYDVGVPCSARQDCQDPVALIFPFQEGEVEKCRTCELVFHKNCFKMLASCPCGAHFKKEETKRSSHEDIHSVDGNSVSLAGTAEPTSGILAGLFSKVMPASSQIPRKREAEGIGNVIPMGSLPSTSL